MKSTKSVRSLRSIQSSKSLRSGRDLRKGENSIMNFDHMLNVACARFQCPYTVIIKKESTHDHFYKALLKPDAKAKSKRMSFISQAAEKASKAPSSASSHSSTSHSDTPSVPDNSIIVSMLYDTFNTLTEIAITNRKDVPRVLLKIIRVLVPFYQNLTRITISKCRIDMYTIHELSKMLKESTINNICLDGSTMPRGDFTMLLNTSNLTSLSLCRCKIDDNDCELIASKLHGSAAADNLLLLNLTSNRITDVGAKYIADSLRTNRHLRYLNLADNHIQDEGAGYIFDMLMEFPLTYNEIMSMKRRRMNYLKMKNDLYCKYLADHRNTSYDGTIRSLTSRKKSKNVTKKEKDRPSTWATDEYLKAKAEMMALDILGHFQDPFQPDNVRYEDKYYYSLGNVTLQYLNLAYNNLSYISVQKLCNVVKYQNARKLGNRGLTKVVIDGNYLPVSCNEMEIIKNILARKIMRYSGRVSEIARRKGRSLKVEVENE